MATKRHLAYPVLSWEDILSELHGLGMAVSMEDLQRPTDEFVLDLFFTLLAEARGVAVDELRHTQMEGIDHLPHPELHEGSVPWLTAWRYLSQLMAICAVDEWSVRDLSHPDGKRLRRQLSGVINFLRFKEGKNRQYEALFARNEMAVRQRNEIEQMVERATQDLQMAREQREHDLPAFERAEKENDRVSQQLAEVNALCKQKAETMGKLKASVARLDERAEELTRRDQELSEAQIELEGQVVSCPDALRTAIHDYKEKNERLRAAIDTKSETKRQTQVLSQLIETARQRLDARAAALQQTLGSVETSEKAVQELQQSRAEGAAILHKDKALETDQALLKQTIEEKNEKLTQMAQTAKEQDAAHAEAMKKLEERRVQLEADQRSSRRAADELESQCEEWRTKLTDLENKYSTKVQHYQEANAELSRALQGFAEVHWEILQDLQPPHFAEPQRTRSRAQTPDSSRPLKRNRSMPDTPMSEKENYQARVAGMAS
mmetsp:Transcript_3840/g.9049  ORF Transcript_3840/g.9049 Transcript_3840/m.9049 type:complete len:492 (+) Transcript_3840:36-1511(+)